MTIQVRVLSASALAQLRALEMQSARTATGVGAVGQKAAWGLPYLSKWGNQVQWAGRQLMYNFSIPIALAGAAATKFALDNERGMTRIVKVYGDGSRVFKRLSQTEIPALEGAMEALSNRFGVQRKEVLQIAGDYAAAGASGIALAKSVKLTLETMVLGEMDAAEATKNLIAIQAQYGMNTTQLAHTIDILNMVENQTGASMKDLMDGMSRAAGVARTSGVDVEHLSAMMAALVPAAGSAANAGNALKTIISRILSPTADATDLMKEMGIQVDATAWNSLTATQRLEQLSKSFEGLSSAQKAHVATVLGSRWQLNKLIVLMQAVQNENSYYNKSLRSTADAQKVFNQRQFELQKVLSSNPQKVKQVWVILQNAMADVILPLIPLIVYLGQSLAKLGTWFSNLNPEVQKLSLALLLFLAAIGPIARYVGAVANLLGLLGAAAHFAAKSFIWLGKQTVLLATRLLFLRFLPLVAGFKKLGKAALILGATLGNAARFAVMAIGKSFAPLGRTMIASLMVGLRGMVAPFIAIWRVMLVQLTVAWRFFLMGVTVATVAWTASMKAIWIALMVTLRAVVVAGNAAINAAYAAIWSTSIAGTVIFKATLISIWAGLMYALQGLTIAVGAALVTSWTAVQMLLSRATAAGAAAIRIAYAGALAASQAFVAGTAAAFTILPKLIMGLGQILFAALTNPYVLAAIAIAGIVYSLRDKIASAWDNIVHLFSSAANAIPGFFAPVVPFFHKISKGIVDAFWALPSSITSALIAVVNVVSQAALQVYEWLSYLNPFATHSPSLVSQVKDGMKVIGDEYVKGSKRAAATKAAHDTLKFAINDQQRVVDRWKKALDAANNALDAQQTKLDGLNDHLSKLTDQYNAHQDKLDAYAAAPIKGMKAMDDQIFANEMAQKKLRLELLKMDEATSPIDNVESKLAALNGTLEILRGTGADLRSAGAGSEILGPIQTQIDTLQSAAANLTKTVQTNSPAQALQKQLDELQKKGEILDLQKAIKFDPMTRQIDNLANGQKELSFDDIVNGVNAQRNAMNRLQPSIDAATAAVARQQAVVDSATASRDAISRRYDLENQKLTDMRHRYDELSDAMSRNKDAADKIKSAKKLKMPSVSDAVKTFRAAQGADWADVGGKAKIGREGGMGDQSKLIEDFAKQQSSKLGSMFDKFDMWGPLKRKWTQTWTWLKENVGPVAKDVRDAITAAFTGTGDMLSSLITNIKTGDVDKKLTSWLHPFEVAWNTAKGIVGFVVKWIMRLVRLFGPDIKKIFDEFVKAGKRIWKEVGPALIDLFKALWPILKVVAEILGGVLLFALKIISHTLANVIGPVLNTIIDLFLAFIRIVKGVAEVIVGLFTLDFTKINQGFLDIFAGMIEGIWAILKGAGKIIWGIIKGIVEGIVDFFKWLYDVLVGHSIVPDLVDAIANAFKPLIKLGKWIWDHVLKPVVNFFKDLWHDTKTELGKWWNNITKAWDVLKKIGGWVWDNILNPILNKFKSLWTDHLKGWLEGFWGKITSAWDKLKKLGGWIWTNVLAGAMKIWREFWTDHLKVWLEGLWDKIKSALNGVTNLGTWFFNHVITPVMNKVRDFLGPGGTLRSAFRDAVDAIGRIFDGLREMAAAPVRFVVNTVYNNGIRAALNKIPGVNLKEAHFDAKKTGGVLPGYTPGRDVHQFFSPTAGVLQLSGGEAIMRPEWTRAVGGPKAIEEMNRQAKLGHKPMYADSRFASGGVFWPTTGKRTSTYAGHDGVDINANGEDYGNPIFAFRSGQITYVGWGRGYGQAIFERAPGYPEVVYGHTSQAIVHMGDMVRGGQMIGRVGSTGHSSGPHLHFGVPGGTYGQAMALLAGAGTAPSGTSQGSYVSAYRGPQIEDVEKGLHWKAWKEHLQGMGGFGPMIGNGIGTLKDTVLDYGKKMLAGAVKAAGTVLQGVGPKSSAVQQQVKIAARARGWGDGPQWEALYNVIQHESGWNPNAQNPKSTAYGLFQLIKGNWPGGQKPTSLDAQIGSGLQYVERTYGNPINAWNFWQGHHWYKNGGVIPQLSTGAVAKARRGGTIVNVGEGGNDEAIVPLPRSWKQDAFGVRQDTTTITENHFHGDLVFPNVQNGDDAEEFLENLKTVTKD